MPSLDEFLGITDTKQPEEKKVSLDDFLGVTSVSQKEETSVPSTPVNTPPEAPKLTPEDASVTEGMSATALPNEPVPPLQKDYEAQLVHNKPEPSFPAQKTIIDKIGGDIKRGVDIGKATFNRSMLSEVANYSQQKGYEHQISWIDKMLPLTADGETVPDMMGPGSDLYGVNPPQVGNEELLARKEQLLKEKSDAANKFAETTKQADEYLNNIPAPEVPYFGKTMGGLGVIGGETAGTPIPVPVLGLGATASGVLAGGAIKAFTGFAIKNFTTNAGIRFMSDVVRDDLREGRGEQALKTTSEKLLDAAIAGTVATGLGTITNAAPMSAAVMSTRQLFSKSEKVINQISELPVTRAIVQSTQYDPQGRISDVVVPRVAKILDDADQIGKPGGKFANLTGNEMEDAIAKAKSAELPPRPHEEVDLTGVPPSQPPTQPPQPPSNVPPSSSGPPVNPHQYPLSDKIAARTTDAMSGLDRPAKRGLQDLAETNAEITDVGKQTKAWAKDRDLVGQGDSLGESLRREEAFRRAGVSGIDEKAILDWKAGDLISQDLLISANAVLNSRKEELSFIAKMARTDLESGATDTVRTAIDTAMVHLDVLAGKVMGINSAAGRILRSAGRDYSIPNLEQLRFIGDELSKLKPGTKEYTDFAKAYFNVLENPANKTAVNNLVSKKVPPGFADKFAEYFMSSLFSSSKTGLANLIGNAASMLMTVPEKYVAAGVGNIRKALGAQDTTGFKDAHIYLQFMGNGVMTGLRNAKRAALTGETTIGQYGRLDQPLEHAIGGLTGKIIRKPVDVYLKAPDEFARGMFYSAGLAKSVKNFVENTYGKNLSPQKFATLFNKHYYDPTAQMIKEAVKEANYRTFADALESGISREVIRLLKTYPAARTLIPIVTTPVNIIKYGVERTPLGLISPSMRTAYKAGGKEFDEKMSRVIMGTMTLGLGYLLALNGNITGGLSEDPNVRKTQMDNGFKPYSAVVKSLGLTVSYMPIEPLATIMGIAADLPEIQRTFSNLYRDQEKGPKGEASLNNVLNRIKSGNYDGYDDIKSIMPMINSVIYLAKQNFAEKSMVKNMYNLLELVEDSQDENRIGKFVGQTIAPIFAPAALKDIASIIDPKEKDTSQNILHPTMARIPGLREMVPNKQGLFGEEIQSPHPVLGTLTPFANSRMQNNPVYSEISRLDMGIKKPSLKLTGTNRDMNSEQYSYYKQEIGTVLRPALEALVKSDGYKKLADEDKKKEISKQLSIATSTAHDKVLKKYPELIEDVKKEELRKHDTSNPRPRRAYDDE